MGKKVIIYTRVSTDDQAEGYSLSAQFKSISKYCQDKDYVVIEHYQDDHSAKDFERPEYQRFLSDLKGKRIKPDLLIVTKVDRFSRNVFLTYAMVEELNKMGVKVHTIAEGEIDFSNSKTFFPMLVQAGAAQYDNIQRSENVTNGMREALKQGRWVWFAPIGYINDVGKGTLSFHPTKSLLVQEAFDLIATGNYSPDAVFKIVRKKGLSSARSAFYKMIKNPFYIGKIVIPANDKTGDIEEVVEGLHKPLIDEGTFYEVQNILSGKKKISQLSRQ